MSEKEGVAKFMRGPIIVVNLLLWAFFLATSATLVVGSVLIRILTKPFDPNLKILQQYSAFWASLYLWFNPFWSLKKTGIDQIPKNKTFVMVSNHQSMADILVVFNSFLHFKWVAKDSAFHLPFLGWNMRLNGYVPIHRGDTASREACLEKCRNWLKQGSSVLFFPEGTRSKDGTLLPFKPGAFRLALETGCDILPLVINGSLHAIPKHSLWLHGRSRMTLTALLPITTQAYRNQPLEAAVAALMQEVRIRIAAALSLPT